MRRAFFADFKGSAPVSGSGHWTAAPLATACNRGVHGHQNRTRRLPAGCDRRGRWLQDRRREAAPGNEPDRGRQVARPVLGPGAQAAPELREGAAGVSAGVPGGLRSEERRAGKEWVVTCIFSWSQDPDKKKTKKKK